MRSEVEFNLGLALGNPPKAFERNGGEACFSICSHPLKDLRVIFHRTHPPQMSVGNGLDAETVMAMDVSGMEEQETTLRGLLTRILLDLYRKAKWFCTNATTNHVSIHFTCSLEPQRTMPTIVLKRVGFIIQRALLRKEPESFPQRRSKNLSRTGNLDPHSTIYQGNSESLTLQLLTSASGAVDHSTFKPLVTCGGGGTLSARPGATPRRHGFHGRAPIYPGLAASVAYGAPLSFTAGPGSIYGPADLAKGVPAREWNVGPPYARLPGDKPEHTFDRAPVLSTEPTSSIKAGVSREKHPAVMVPRHVKALCTADKGSINMMRQGDSGSSLPLSTLSPEASSFFIGPFHSKTDTHCMANLWSFGGSDYLW